MNNRLLYIDALRGLSIFMVIYCHIDGFIFDNQSEVSLWFDRAMLPIFFFISGFLSWKNTIKEKFTVFVSNKITDLVIPTLACLSIYIIAFDRDIYDAFIGGGGEYKIGYWFTLVLAEIFILVYPVNRLIINKSKIYQSVCLLILIIILNILVKINQIYLLSDNSISNLFSLRLLLQYSQFFIFGMIVKINFNTFIRFIANNKWFLPVMFASYCLILDKSGFYWYALKCYMNLIFFFYLFYFYQAKMDRNPVFKMLGLIGNHTKQIYFIHYFLLFGTMGNLSSVGYITDLIKVPLGEIAIVGTLTILIAFICIYISKAINISPFLKKLLWGFKIS